MSNLSLERLLFDPTAPSDGPSVGSYLVSLGGNVITDTGSALDVNISSSDIDIQIDIDTSNFVADDEVFTENGMPIGYRAHDASSALGALSADGDKSDALSDLYRRLFINDAPNIAGSNEAVSVDTTAGGVALPTTPAAGRTRMLVQNQGNQSIFAGFGTVTAANGIEISKGGTLSLEIGEALALKAIAASGTQDVRVMELS